MNLDKIISVYKWCVVGIGTTISTLLGGWDIALAVLVGFVIPDVIGPLYFGFSGEIDGKPILGRTIIDKRWI